MLRNLRIIAAQPANPAWPGHLGYREELPLRWMVILCVVCEHKLVGGGGGDVPTMKGIEIIYFLHQLVQSIHTRRLQGDYSIPTIQVDSLMEERVRLVIAESETADDWWLQSNAPGTDPIISEGLPGQGPASFPRRGGP